MKSASLQYATALGGYRAGTGSRRSPRRNSWRIFGAAYEESAELRNFLASPAITREAKHGVIEKLVARLGASKIIRNFLFVMADNQRIHLLPDIVDTFEQVLRQRQGVAEAAVTSAVELNDGAEDNAGADAGAPLREKNSGELLIGAGVASAARW